MYICFMNYNALCWVGIMKWLVIVEACVAYIGRSYLCLVCCQSNKFTH